MTHTLPRRLHSVQTLVDGISGRRPCEERGEHLEQLPLVDRATAQLEVDANMGGDRVEVASVETYSGDA